MASNEFFVSQSPLIFFSSSSQAQSRHQRLSDAVTALGFYFSIRDSHNTIERYEARWPMAILFVAPQLNDGLTDRNDDSSSIKNIYCPV